MVDKETIIVSFSGGETSAYMAIRLKTEYGHIFNFVFIFANTGLENEKTLIFIRLCDEAYGLGIIWVEAIVNPIHGKGITHKIIDFYSASRNGEPFEAHVAKSGIPNANKPQCSDRLKAMVIEDYKKKHGLKGKTHCIGIRKDEEKRRCSVNSIRKYNICYPLTFWIPADKEDVQLFWEDQPFRLQLEPHEGNCQTCWKKSDRKLWLLALEHPRRFDFMRRMEQTYQHVKPNDDGTPRVFFRRHRSCEDIFNEASEMDAGVIRKMIGYSDDSEDGCGSSCEAYDI